MACSSCGTWRAVRLILSEEWGLGLRGRSGSMATVGRIAKVCDRCVGGAAVVPEHDRSRAPSYPGLELSSFLDVVVKELKDGIALLLLETDDLSAELPIDEQSLFTGHGMRADERVDVLDRLSLDNPSATTAASVVCLGNARMQDGERLKVLPEWNRELLVGCSLIGVAFVEQSVTVSAKWSIATRPGIVVRTGVASAWRAVVQPQASQTGRLFLVCDIGVPGRGGQLGVGLIVEVLGGTSAAWT